MEKLANVEYGARIATITINRPATLNALSDSLLRELDRTITEVEQNVSTRVVIITGTGRSFVAGADISEMMNMSPDEARDYANYGALLFRRIETLNKVTIAAINGYALGGGCELALACDIRIASDNAKFGQPEVGLGVIPGFSGIRRMMEIVGEAKAKEYIFSGRTIDAYEAEGVGLVNKVVSPDHLMDACRELAEVIAGKSFNAVLSSKKVMNAIKGNLANALTVQSEFFSDCFTHPDQKTGMSAFLNKEIPSY